MSAAKCAFDRCQAGGDILPGAPRVERQQWTGRALGIYHPGCWEASKRLDDHRQSHTDVRPSKESAHA